MELPYGVEIMQQADTSELEKVLLNEAGQLKILPAAIYDEFDPTILRLFCHKNAIYNIPTMELLDFIRTECDISRTIEIGSGNGIMAAELGITATDSKQQDKAEMKALYGLMQQPTIPYGANVTKYDALEAIRVYRPQTVIAAWVTHKYNPAEHYREGNMEGPDEGRIISRVQKYLFIGNKAVHGKKPILSKPHKEYSFPWLKSRAIEPSKNIIWVWEK